MAPSMQATTHAWGQEWSQMLWRALNILWLLQLGVLDIDVKLLVNSRRFLKELYIACITSPAQTSHVDERTMHIYHYARFVNFLVT